MRTHHHVCQSVSGALRNWGRKEWSGVADENGITVAALKERFRILEFKGVRVIPFGDRCEGFSDLTGCPGHPIPPLLPEALPEDGVA